MGDAVSEGYADLLEGSYDCVDHIVLNAYNTLCYAPPGFRYWWRQLTGSDATLDNAHLMRMAGRFSRRVRGFAKAHGITVVDCLRGKRKHEIAEEYLATHPSTQGLFLILVARAVAPVWDVQQAKNGVIVDLVSKKAYMKVSLGCAEVRKMVPVRGRACVQPCRDSYAAASTRVSSSQARTRRGACGMRGSPRGTAMS